MPKPKIGQKLPIIKTEELRKALERNGFRNDLNKHAHIQYINKEGVRITLLKGHKDIKSGLLKKIIKEMSIKMKIQEKEVIRKLFNT